MGCRRGCPSQDHASWGECARAARFMVGWARSATDETLDRSYEQRKQAELDLYKSAREQGIQPDGTSTGRIRFALDQSNQHGMGYGEEFRVVPKGRGRYDAVSHKQAAEVMASIEASDHDVLMDAARSIKGD